MKQKQLLIGLGLGLLAYYLYTRSKQKASATPEDKTNSNTTLPNAGGVVAPTPIPSANNSSNAPIGMTLEKHNSNQIQSLKNEDLILQWKYYNCSKKESKYGAIQQVYIRPKDRERNKIFQTAVNQEVQKRGINVKC